MGSWIAGSSLLVVSIVRRRRVDSSAGHEDQHRLVPVAGASGRTSDDASLFNSRIRT